ncbi:MAG TPA: M1 family metallopeptidase [Flavobacteriales bacterium]|nr:M1 family metallopeptidase [Flavobacteriales bacterium]HMR27904.1 M1 family metallopeptidase [Flavobacteriales bacterium]
MRLPPLIASLIALSSATAQTTCLEAKRPGDASPHRSGLQDQRSDSIDILHTAIHLDLTAWANDRISARTVLRFAPLVPGVDAIRLDLIDLTVDSVRDANGLGLGFIHSGGTLLVDLGQPYGPGDEVEIAVHYQGEPATDPSNFGGFYLESQYLYNLGVAFTSQPHSYGRSWFPCFDNFVERSSFSFHITTNGPRSAWCNGRLLGTTPLGGDTLLTEWELLEPIPGYLASVAAGNYRNVHLAFTSIDGDTVPVDLVALPADTAQLRASFVHLQNAFDRFESCFGAYRWNRIGYHLASRGAMEHSTNITYPDFIADGSTQYEATMAHELAHQWFGDLVTCARAEEMYINEGFAEYLSYLFLEAVHGPGRYRNTVRANHYAMLRRCHWEDGGEHYALSEVPQEWTYGEHSYNKGADVLHTLRSYLGDAAFCSGLTSFLDTYAFQPVTTTQLRDHLSAATGQDLTAFFDDWILQPGWAGFEVDSFAVVPQGAVFSTTVHVEQKLRAAQHLYSDVPMSVTFVSATGDRWSPGDPIPLGGAQTTFTVDAPFAPVDVLLNADDRISQAVTAVEDTLNGPGTVNLQQADVMLIAQSIPTPTPLRVEQYWTAADAWTDPPFLYMLSPDRWWRVHGSFPTGTQIRARITYDGRANSAGGLDVGLMADLPGLPFHEDSVLLLHRPNAHFPWSPWPQQTRTTLNSPTDRTGRIEAEGLQPGDYTLARRTSAVGLPPVPGIPGVRTWPDPTSEQLTIAWPGDPPRGTVVRLRDQAGRLLREAALVQPFTHVSVEDLPAQTVQVTVVGPQGLERGVGRCTIVR